MPRPKDTIENRVYLFESLARGFLEQSSALLASEREHDRARALRALSDLAFVSCVVADTAEEPPERVRALVADRAPAPPRRPR